MTTIHSDDGHPRLWCKGAPRELLGRCTSVRVSGRVMPLSDDVRRAAEAANDANSRDALRVLAVAVADLDEVPDSPDPDVLERDLTLLGLVALLDPPNDEVAEAIRTCRRAGSESRSDGHLAGGTAGRPGHAVTVLDDRPRVLDRVRAAVPAAVTVAGAGSDPRALEAAGIRTADVVAAVTAVEEVNVLACCLAKEEFGVPRIVDPETACMYVGAMGVDVALDQAELMATLVVEEMSLGDMVTLLKLSRGRYALVEERVHGSAPAAGRAVADLDLPAHAVLVYVLRGTEPLLATPDLVLVPGDEVIAREAPPWHRCTPCRGRPVAPPVAPHGVPGRSSGRTGTSDPVHAEQGIPTVGPWRRRHTPTARRSGSSSSTTTTSSGAA